ncbi:hypothetical protein ACH9L7_10575 [Haloferax sp. S1W]|uniref:hypothetical protein n=1 Tax=Haloferax sp. S1W TaxID=3377110 RepID=UPI0037CCA793
MAATASRRIALLLTLVTLLLVSLAPWGPIETRSFAHLSPAVYWGFNAFLILLGLGSFATAYRLWTGTTDALLAAIVAGVLYIAVYVLDLAGIFPTSPDSMPPLLLAIEVVDSLLALVLVVYSYWVWNRATPKRPRTETRAS